MQTGANATELRVLVFAPIGRDGALTVQLLQRAGLPCHLCGSILAICEQMRAGAGAILMTEEVLYNRDIDALATTLAAQPAWSDISVLLFAGDVRGEATLRTLPKLEVLRNVTLLDRPMRIAAVISTVQAAIRGRQRQYQLRDVLVALQAARTDAERANRLKDDFLATLSHELRTPLNAILGWVYMLRKSQIDVPRIPRILEIVEKNAHLQSQLISDVLDVSRMITGQIQLQLGPQSLPRILADAVDSVRPTAEAKGVALSADPIDDVLWVTADAQRLQQVFWNLLLNAVKFTPAGGSVNVTARRVGPLAEIAVTDTGIGITSDFLPFVFERFRQADQTFTRAHGGLGLGLAIVKNLVEMHGGEVSAASAGAGAGATFCVRLPIASERPRVAGIERPVRWTMSIDRLPPVDLANRLVLVVDDDPTSRELLVAILEQCRARVVAADSARAAMNEIDREVPAVIVADIGMPEEDGLALMRRLRERPAERGGRVPSIALSAYARAEDQRAAFAAGFNEFVTKPAMPADIVRVVGHWVTVLQPR